MSLKYFKYEEFASPDVPDSGEFMDSQFLTMLDNAREIAGIPFKINSGYKTEFEPYRWKGGGHRSQKLKGKTHHFISVARCWIQ